MDSTNRLKTSMQKAIEHHIAHGKPAVFIKSPVESSLEPDPLNKQYLWLHAKILIDIDMLTNLMELLDDEKSHDHTHALH